LFFKTVFSILFAYATRYILTPEISRFTHRDSCGDSDAGEASGSEAGAGAEAAAEAAAGPGRGSDWSVP